MVGAGADLLFMAEVDTTWCVWVWEMGGWNLQVIHDKVTVLAQVSKSDTNTCTHHTNAAKLVGFTQTVNYLVLVETEGKEQGSIRAMK